MSIKNLVNYEIPESKSPEKKGSVAKLAWKLLAYFLIFMILFSILGRSMSSMTTAKVSVVNGKSGTLEHSFKFSGNLENNHKLAVGTNGGILIAQVNVKKGSEVKEGDVLMVLDQESLETEYLKAKKALDDAKYTISDANSKDAVQDYKDDKNLERLKEDYNNQVISDGYSAYPAAVSVQEAWDALQNFDWSKYEVEDTSAGNPGDLFSDDMAGMRDAVWQQLNADVEYYRMELDNARAATNPDVIESRFRSDFYYDTLMTTVPGYEIPQAAFNQDVASLAYAAYGMADPEGKTQSDPYISAQMVARYGQTINEIQSCQTFQEALNKVTLMESKYSEATAALENYERVLAERKTVSEEEKARKHQEGVEAYNRLVRAYDLACNSYSSSLHSNSVSEQARLRAIEDTDDPVPANDREENDRQYNLDVARKAFDKLRALMDTNGEIRATASGTILNVNAMEGGKTSDDSCFVIGDSSQGYTFQGSITKDQTKYLKLGSNIVISTFNHGSTENLDAMIEDITVSPDDRDTFYVTASVTNDGSNCASYGEVSVQLVSEKYDTIVPNAAIKEEKEGNYVFVVEESAGILGKTLKAKKVQVTVKDRDDNNSAISMYGLMNASIIVSADRTLNEGDNVRLNES